jgi:hypothetical protein
VIPGKDNASNAVGLVGPSTYAITTPPYQLSSCDQVLLIEGQRIKDMRDYALKEKAFFTFSMYMINVSLEKNPEKFIDSLTMEKINTIPYVMLGAPACVNFQSPNKNIAICFDKEEYTTQIIQVYNDFLKCRKGIKILTVEEMRHIVEQCQKGIVVTGNAPAGNTILPSTPGIMAVNGTHGIMAVNGTPGIMAVNGTPGIIAVNGTPGIMTANGSMSLNAQGVNMGMQIPGARQMIVILG